MRRSLRRWNLIGLLALVGTLAAADFAAADDCSSPEDCSNTAWTVGTAAGVGAGAAGAAGAAGWLGGGNGRNGNEGPQGPIDPRCNEIAPMADRLVTEYQTLRDLAGHWKTAEGRVASLDAKIVDLTNLRARVREAIGKAGVDSEMAADAATGSTGVGLLTSIADKPRTPGPTGYTWMGRFFTVVATISGQRAVMASSEYKQLVYADEKLVAVRDDLVRQKELWAQDAARQEAAYDHAKEAFRGDAAGYRRQYDALIEQGVSCPKAPADIDAVVAELDAASVGEPAPDGGLILLPDVPKAPRWEELGRERQQMEQEYARPCSEYEKSKGSYDRDPAQAVARIEAIKPELAIWANRRAQIYALHKPFELAEAGRNAVVGYLSRHEAAGGASSLGFTLAGALPVSREALIAFGVLSLAFDMYSRGHSIDEVDLQTAAKTSGWSHVLRSRARRADDAMGRVAREMAVIKHRSKIQYGLVRAAYEGCKLSFANAVRRTPGYVIPEPPTEPPWYREDSTFTGEYDAVLPYSARPFLDRGAADEVAAAARGIGDPQTAGEIQALMQKVLTW